MFECDRFDNTQDYEKSYRSFGGRKLTNPILHKTIYYIYGILLNRSRDKNYIDDMIRVDELIFQDNYFNDYSEEDKILIEKVFAHHECGTIPTSCRETLDNLSKTHKLGLILNVWCKSSYFINRLKTYGVYELFDLMIFSSDHRSVKPSKKLFDKAVNHFRKKPGKIV